MKFLFILPLCALIFVGIQGCGVATSSDVRGAYVRQAKTEERVDQLEKEIEALKFQIRDIGSANLDPGQVRRIEYRLDQLDQSLSTLGSRLAGLERRGAAPAFRPFAPRPLTTPIEQRPGASVPAIDVFDLAYKELSKGKYPEARALFKQYINESPNSSKSADARYWIAESYYREKKFEESILGFQTFIDSYPRDTRIPLAYLKQGLSLIDIQRYNEAKLFLQTLIDRYPMSEEARIAKEKMRDLALEGQ